MIMSASRGWREPRTREHGVCVLCCVCQCTKSAASNVQLISSSIVKSARPFAPLSLCLADGVMEDLLTHDHAVSLPYLLRSLRREQRVLWMLCEEEAMMQQAISAPSLILFLISSSSRSLVV